MANYSQPPPPYGMPFPFMPHQSAPAIQADAQSAPSDPRHQHAPNAEALQQMWNWQNLNLQAYNQNQNQTTQQPPYPMWPPPSPYQQSDSAPLPFPPPFLTQNGFVPPPPPGITFYPPPPLPQVSPQYTPASSTMQAPVFAPTPIHPIQQLPTLNAGPPHQSVTATNDRIVEMMDNDKEDGEVSDGDRATRSPAVNDRPVAEPPRSVPQGLNSNRNEVRRHDAGPSHLPHNGDNYGHGGKDSGSSRPQAMSQTLGAIGVDHLAPRRDDAIRFVRSLHDNQIGYPSLAAEGLDPQLLKDLYRRSNLPLPQELARAPAKATSPFQAPVKAPIRAPIPPVQVAPVLPPAQTATQAPIQAQKIVPSREPTTNGALTLNLTTSYSNVRYPKPPTTDAALQVAPLKPTPAVKTNITQTPPVKSAPSPIDRKDYIARLQAAKMAKQSAGNKVTPPQQTPSPKVVQATNPVTTTIPNPPQALMNIHGNDVPKAKQPVTEEEKARKTELIRQRLEAMRAKQTASSPAAPQASKLATPSSTTTAEVFLSSLQNTVHMQSPTPQPSQLAQPFQRFQTAQSISAPSFSGIPGLFMNTPTPNARTTVRPVHATAIQSPPEQPQNTITTSTKRRAVASDLEEITTPTSSGPGPTYTRPLGQSPHDHDGASMIIEVSDDESGGSEMDIDDDQPVPKVVAVATPDSHQIGQQPLRNFPPLTDFPSRSTSVKPVSSAVSTPGPQTPATFARKEELQKKEKDLADLKLRLMLKMQEQRQLKAAAAASSPMPQKATKQTDLIVPLPPLQPKLADPTHSLKGDSSIAAPTSTSQDFARESKRKRRAEIESGLPSLEAEIANNTARMAQISKEMEDLKVNNEKISQDKEKLVRELESLGIDTEGMPHAELQAKKDKIDQELQTESDVVAEEATVPASSIYQSAKDGRNGNRSVSPPMISQSEPKTNGANDTVVPQLLEEVQPVEKLILVPKVDAPIAVALSPVAQPEAASVCRVADYATSESEPNGAADPETASAGTMLESQQEGLIVRASATVSDTANNEAATPVDDDEDFYSPEPTITVTLDNEPRIEKALEPAVRSPSEDEIEMSESSLEEEEEEYVPEEPQVIHSSADMGNSPAPTSTPSDDEDDEEMYEPPEPELNPQMVDADSNTVNTSAVPILQPAEEDGAMDMSTSSSDESDDSVESDVAQQSSSEPANHGSISFNNTSDLPRTVAHNPTPHLHFQTVPMVQPEATEPIPTSTDMVESAGFVPYESPLRMFKSYRYHPSFLQDVSGGFLSMTYSHQIDPQKPLCQFESVGGTCNDPECTDQHFRSMNISGEKLLVQLGTANPGKTPDEKQLWNDGLRGVLKELRQKNIKDPNGIAVEIAKYRRQFLNDDTRVVNL